VSLRGRRAASIIVTYAYSLRLSDEWMSVGNVFLWVSLGKWRATARNDSDESG